MTHKYLFVGGLHRSGTSLLFKCMKEHPQISGFSGTGVPEDEGQHLQTIFKPAFEHGGASRFGFDPEAHLTETSRLITQENRERLHAEWGKHWDMSRRILVEKSPPNLIRARFFQKMFDDTYFLIIRRHPIAYAYPREKRNERANVYSLVKHWLRCQEIFEEDRPLLKNLFVMKYENFVGDPNGYLDRIYEWLGIEQFATNQQVQKDINRKYFAGWLEMKQKLFYRPYVKLITARFEDRVRRTGYSLVDLNYNV